MEGSLCEDWLAGSNQISSLMTFTLVETEELSRWLGACLSTREDMWR